MRKFLSLLALLTFSALFAFSQEVTVTGTVKDESGAPVPFATISETGRKSAVIADENGNFSIKVRSNAKLGVSAAGFDPITLTPEGNILNVSLKRNNTELTTVVVTALGQRTSKAKVGYSTSTFNSEAINRTANVSAFDALAGKVAGAEISNTGGPGSSTKIILRGYGVIAGGGNQPLYVIDGVPLSDARPGSPGHVAVANADFSTIGLTTQNDFGNAAREADDSSRRRRRHGARAIEATAERSRLSGRDRAVRF
jgi:hypothetical protein